jgi:tetratricopeptide (TPR) repeat protein
MRLAVNDIRRREAEDPENPGFLVDSVERREIGAVAERACLSAAELRLLAAFGFGSPKSRQEALERFGDEPERLIYAAGEYRRSLELLEPAVNRSQHEGRIADALIYWSDIVRCRVALGELAAAETAYERARALGERLVAPSPHLLGLVAAKHEILIAVDEGWKDYLRTVAPLALQPAIEHVWNLAAFWASGARLYARLGRAEEALQLLAMLIPALERGPAWGPHYAALPCYGAAALWMLSRTEHIDAIERNLRQKVLEPDFRHPMIDGRLALAQLCALQGRYEEAVAAFDRARAVLEEQEARSLRAIVDFDEGVMYLRRARQGDRRLARPLLRVALEQFRILGMRGWVRQAEQLLA